MMSARCDPGRARGKCRECFSKGTPRRAKQARTSSKRWGNTKAEKKSLNRSREADLVLPMLQGSWVMSDETLTLIGNAALLQKTTAQQRHEPERRAERSKPSRPSSSARTEANKREPGRRLPLLPVAALLDAQRTLTAVERFAKHHQDGELPAQAKYYRRLLPTERPKDGEQYGFEVDLDKCTGCKACVAACHSLNGLAEDETWRTVGLLHGGSSEDATVQTVTTSCHHCIEPACMSGCPVNAYQKDSITGIVKHLDDQCFGCQYCTLMCPYDAPKFNTALGIVRKCDMCSDRLEHGEAPACVQSCPSEAIAIRIVDQAHAIQMSEANAFLPGAPAPDHTLPTTSYKTKRVLPKNLLPADFYAASPEHAHLPLVIMLTLTQLSVGAFAWGTLVALLLGAPPSGSWMQSAFACALALLALGASVFHLGRPWLAWRAVLNLRRSWLSREALVFGLFAQLAVAFAVVAAVPAWPVLSLLEPLVPYLSRLQIAASAAGLAGVFCSVMVYVATRRAHWSPARTGLKFFGTTLVLGAATVLALAAATGTLLEKTQAQAVEALVAALIAGSGIKLSYELSLLRHYRAKVHGVDKRMARVLLGDLKGVTVARFAMGFLGGIGLPWFGVIVLSSGHAIPALWITAALAVLIGEGLERYSFFRAAPSSRMPGGLR